MEIFLGLIQIIWMVFCVIYPKKEKSENEKTIKLLIGYISVINDQNNKRIVPMEKTDLIISMEKYLKIKIYVKKNSRCWYIIEIKD